MSSLSLITGSTLGGAEYVADHLAELLEDNGHQVEVINQAEFSELDQNTIWLIICSTHGAGDYPDNFLPFVEQLTQQQPTLNGVKFAVIGLGDRNYDTFCAAGKKIEGLLLSLGANQIGERLDIDVSETPVPEEPAEAWFDNWKNLITD